jgi:hypothetical protein
MINMDKMYEPSFEDILVSQIRDWGIDNVENSFAISLSDLTDKYWESNLTHGLEGNELELTLEAEGSEPIMDLENTYGEQPYV